MASKCPCRGDVFTPYGDAPMPAPNERTCEVCGNASKEAAEAAMLERTGMKISLPGPFGKCLGSCGLDRERGPL